MRHIMHMVILATIGLVLIAASPVLAQTTTTGPTEVGVWSLLEPVRPLLTELLSILIAALVGFLTVKINKWLGLNIEAKHREALQMALKNGAMAGLAKVQSMTADARVDVKSEIVAQALVYASKSAPDAIAYFGLTPERLREMIEAKIPAVAP